MNLVTAGNRNINGIHKTQTALLEPFLMYCGSTETQLTESLTPPADTTTRGIGSHSGSATTVASPFIPPRGFQITHTNMQPLILNGRCVWCKGHAIRGWCLHPSQRTPPSNHFAPAWHVRASKLRLRVSDSGSRAGLGSQPGPD
jgi:hypothetical protein